MKILHPWIGLITIFTILLLFYLIPTKYNKVDQNIKKDNKVQDEITISVILDRLQLTQKWFLNNTNPKSKLLYYQYDPQADSYSLDNNHVRQLGTLVSLTQLDRLFRDGALTSLIQTNLTYYLKFKQQKNDRAQVFIDGQSNLAYNAFIILSLLNIPQFPQKEALSQQLAEGILSLQQDDGSYQTLTGIDYYPGEALLALIKLYQQTKDQKYLDSANKAFYYYRDYWRGNKNTAFIPWHTQAYFILYQHTKNKELADFILEMNDWVIDNHQIVKTDNLDLLGAFTKDEPDNSTASYLEGINDAYTLAKMLDDNTRINKYLNSIKLGTQFILKTQITFEGATNFADPIRAIGGFSRSLTDAKQRIDYTQHAITALIKALNNKIFESEGQLDQDEISPKKRTSEGFPKSPQAKKFLEIIKKEGDGISKETIANYYDAVGPQLILDIISQGRDCHLTAHQVGKVIFTKNKDLNKSMQICGYSCTNGCFHGVLMAMFSDKTKGDDHLSLAEIKDDLKNFCDQDTIKDYIKKGVCIHGLGHVVMFLSNYDLDSAIAFCQLFLDIGPIYYCATGVFMERSQVMGVEDSKRSQLSPCDSYDFPAACYRYKIRMMMEPSFPYSQVSAICLKIKDPNERQGCFHGLGFGYYKIVAKDPKKLADLCKEGDATDQRMCIEGAIGILSNNQADQALKACAYLDQAGKKVCVNSIKVGNFGMNRDFKLYYYIRG